jgi:cell division GTPase FtsZ
MVHASIHHPSVILHGFFNEGPSNDPNACKGYETLSQTVQNLVGTPAKALVTWASDKKTSDKCFDSAQVISFNELVDLMGVFFIDLMGVFFKSALLILLFQS